MPDTKIRKTVDGWIDVDNPQTFHRVRRLARDARRASSPTSQRSPTRRTTTVTVVGYQAPQAMTGLQQRLFDRLTTHQGVDHDDALNIILTNGYNKAASYGHMCAAGASHAEASIVISLNSPDVSVAYGHNRAAGMNHTDALARALAQDVST